MSKDCLNNIHKRIRSRKGPIVHPIDPSTPFRPVPALTTPRCHGSDSSLETTVRPALIAVKRPWHNIMFFGRWVRKSHWTSHPPVVLSFVGSRFNPLSEPPGFEFHRDGAYAQSLPTLCGCV